MKIKSVEPLVSHVPVTGAQIAGSMHGVALWGVVGARIETEDRVAGCGFFRLTRQPGAGTTPTPQVWERSHRRAD